MYHIYSMYNDFGSYSHICHVANGSNMKLELDLNKLTRRYCKVLHSRTWGVFANSNFVRSPTSQPRKCSRNWKEVNTQSRCLL